MEAEAIFNENLKTAHKYLGKGVTTDTQLNKVGKSLFGNDFIGTFPCDEIPNNLSKKTQYMIINNKPRKHGGEHWVACCNISDVVYVFDSFGRSTESLIPSLFIGRGIIIDTDYDKDQRYDQKDCGARCIAWIKLFDEYGVDNALLI